MSPARGGSVPERSHWPSQDDPAATADAVLPFLREQLGAQS